MEKQEGKGGGQRRSQWGAWCLQFCGCQKSFILLDALLGTGTAINQWFTTPDVRDFFNRFFFSSSHLDQPAPKLQPLRQNPLFLRLGINSQLILQKTKTNVKKKPKQLHGQHDLWFREIVTSYLLCLCCCHTHTPLWEPHYTLPTQNIHVSVLSLSGPLDGVALCFG